MSFTFTFTELLVHHISFYLRQEFSLEKSIVKGYQEAYEEAIERIVNGERVDYNTN